MRVLHLNTERTWRGGERQTFWLARELQSLGHENWVACRPGFPLDEKSREAGLAIFPIRPWLEADLWAASRLKRFLREQRIDVLHAHTGHAVGLGALAVLGTATKFVATRRVDFPLQTNVFSRWKYLKLDGMAAISGPIQRILMKGGIPAARIAVIPSGIDTSGYPSASDRFRSRAEKGYSEKDVLIVHVGALVPHKDQNTLLRAAQLVFKQKPDAQLVILGDGPLRGELTTLAESLGITGQVHFLGHRPDVLKYIAAADVFVFSSVEEGLGTTLLDALAVGIPTVATRAGGIPDIYGSPDAPELVPSRDPQALAQGLLAVLTNPDEARRRVERGRQLVKGFTVKAMAGRYEEMYKNLCRKT